MKKYFNNILAIAMALFMSVSFSYYSTIGRITGYDLPSDTLYITTTDGNLWEYEGIEDWLYNDFCSMVFCDNGTDDITDDEIIYMRYIGYFENGIERN